MKQVTITNLVGRRNQANSFDLKPGTMEIARELVAGNDGMLTKPRGYQIVAAVEDTLGGFGIYRDATFVFESDNPATASKMYRLVESGGETRALSGSQAVTVLVTSGGRPAEGPSGTNTQVGLFKSPSAATAAVFPERYGALYGLFTPTFKFLALSATGAAGSVVITQSAHRLRVGNRISYADATVGTASNVAITAVTANTYTVPSSFVGTDLVDVTWDDAFQIAAPSVATGTVDAVGASWYALVDVPTTEETPLWSEPRTVQAQRSLFWTGEYDVWKIAAPAGPITRAGVSPGLDLEGMIVPLLGGFKPNSQVAYRVAFGYQDVNGYTLLSAPSSALTLVRNDLIDVATFGAYVPSIVTANTAAAHNLTTGQIIYLYQLTATTSAKSYAITPGSEAIVNVIDPDTFTIDLQLINQENLEFVTGVTALQFGTGESVLLEFTVPDLPANAFAQVYRTTFSVAFNVEPDADYRLVSQANVPPGQIAMTFIDSELDEAVVGGQQLYTNPAVEGEQLANEQPPASTDVDLFKNVGIFSNVWEDPGLELAVIDPAVLAPGGTILLDVVNSASDATLSIRGDASNQAVGNELQYDACTVTANVATITHTGHGLATGDTIFRYFDMGGASYLLTAVTVLTANTFTVPSSSANGSYAVAYAGYKSGAQFLFKRTIASAAIKTSEAIAQTAIDYVKAVNRAGVPLRALYTSGISDAPGKIIVLGASPLVSGSSMVASTVGASVAFAPPLTAADALIQSTRDVHVVAASKVGEFEAVPPVYRFPVGSADAAILAVESLRDSIIVIKQDGVFRINGDTPSNFTVTAVDNTVICAAKNSIVRLNNSVYMLSNQGVVQVTDSAVQIISRDIENDINPLVGRVNLAAATSAVGYENERLYLLATQKVGTDSTTPEIVHCYHYLTSQWTTWEREPALFRHAGVTPQDRIVHGLDTLVRLERKQQVRTDFADDTYAVIPTIGMLSTIDYASGAATATVVTPIKHGLVTGDRITWQSGAPLGLLFSTVARVSDTRFSVSVTPAVGSLSATVAWVKARWGVAVTASVVSGSSVISITASNAETQAWLDGGFAVIQGAEEFLTATNNGILGGKLIQALGGSAYQAQLPFNAVGTVTGQTLLLSDGSNNTSVITILTDNTVPQLGDAVLFGTQLIPILAVVEFSTDVFVITLAGPLFAFAGDNVEIVSGIPSVARTTPINGGNQGLLKYHAEMQASFRNEAACSQVNVSYANDSNYLTADVDWNSQLGTFRLPLQFGSWGSLPWGEFPWGGALSISRQFLSGPAAVLRTFVPKEGFAGTFIQVQVAHRVAGESFDMQSLSIFTQPVTARTSR